MTTETVYFLLPEIVLTTVAAAIYLRGAFVNHDRAGPWLAGAGFVVAAILLALAGMQTRHLGPIELDGLAYDVRWLALGLGLMLALMTPGSLADRGRPEYLGSLVLLIVGLMLTASARELVLLFVGLELISIPTYIVLALGRRDAGGREATAKYFYLSLLASALLLYGFSFLYGAAGATDLAAIRARLAETAAAGSGPLGKLALVLIFAGLGFRIAAVPFHFYAPDVYHGTSHLNAAILSVVPKAAGLVALVRIVAVAMPHSEPYGWRLGLALAVITMTVGNVVALWQDNLRRLMAYSSIAHTGYLLIGLAVAASGATAAAHWDGLGAMLFYLAVYALATVGLFAALVWLGQPGRQVEAIDELAGLARTRPAAAIALAVFLFSLTGIPPLAGFWGKYVIFGSALNVEAARQAVPPLAAWFVVAAVAGVINAAISAAYYLRIVAVMSFRTPLATPPAAGGRGSGLVMALAALAVVALGLAGGPLMRHTMDVGRSLSATAASAMMETEP